MRIDILTIFPGLFEPVLGTSIPGRARDAGLVSYHTTDIRDFAKDKHHKVDDRPFGGGPGMVMMCQPIFDAVAMVEKHDPDAPVTRILLTPQGIPLTQLIVEDLATKERLLIIAGHYEGIDERVIEELKPIELSIGDYILSGGETAALVLIDAVVRLIPGVLGHDQSADEDSFSPTGAGGERLLDCPHYTRPREWMGREVPDVLIGGDHGKIAAWRDIQRLRRTEQRRPDLLHDESAAPPVR
ncbi:MAG: tRNA (guanosine(37)-N1)-methyltransferase TrmD [Phycisphaerales bacterium]|nr:tRNA (guanosine(37)-N1)-methyltransferase TrmD [Phycisphaerales bacterium]